MRRIMLSLILIVCIVPFSGCSNGILSKPPTAAPQVASTPSSTITQTGNTQKAAQGNQLDDVTIAPNAKEGAQVRNDAMPTLIIRVGAKSFSAILYDNGATRAFLERLPLTIEMEELNRNEKYHYFEDDFPTASERVGNIRSGDLMLYGHDCLVLFYESFSTSYSYTRLGYIQDAAGLADALGSGQAQVAFEINE